jgi:hypothetical protein
MRLRSSVMFWLLLVASVAMVSSQLIRLTIQPGDYFAWFLVALWTAVPVAQWFRVVDLTPTALLVRRPLRRTVSVPIETIVAVDVVGRGLVRGWTPQLLLRDGSTMLVKDLSSAGGKRPPRSTVRQVEQIAQWLAVRNPSQPG